MMKARLRVGLRRSFKAEVLALVSGLLSVVSVCECVMCAICGRWRRLFVLGNVVRWVRGKNVLLSLFFDIDLIALKRSCVIPQGSLRFN